MAENTKRITVVGSSLPKYERGVVVSTVTSTEQNDTTSLKLIDAQIVNHEAQIAQIQTQADTQIKQQNDAITVLKALRVEVTAALDADTNLTEG